ncbi:MAG: RNA polymerase sigma factor (TIGR02999 family) [Candidatus Azotimanducaceae bacterium]|jgi:RNA polymerase sigma factor (TIGR02999 family)
MDALTEKTRAISKNEPSSSELPQEAKELFPLIYKSLRQRVKRQRVVLSCRDTLNTTALINEAFIKIHSSTKKDWQGQPHMLEVASLAVKQIIIDYARAQSNQKRGGKFPKLSYYDEIELPENIEFSGIDSEQLLALDIAIDRLAEKDERAGKVVLHKFFGNMTNKEIAATLGVSEATIKRDWNFSRTWLFKQISSS